MRYELFVRFLSHSRCWPSRWIAAASTAVSIGEKHQEAASVPGASDTSGRRLRTHKKIDYAGDKCACTDGCGAACRNRLECRDCDSTNCRNDRCQNREITECIKKGQPCAIVVCDTETRGKGARASRALKANELVGLYPDTPFKRKKHGFFLVKVDSRVVNGANSSAGCINHSCASNCNLEKHTVEGRLTLPIRAKRDIPQGEELTFDYNASGVHFRRAIRVRMWQ